MNWKMKRLVSLIFALVPFLANAQEPEMADGMRAEGKIYVVVAIVLVILIGLLAYLFLMDRRLSALEKRQQNHKS
jgi:CcmD family protein